MGKSRIITELNHWLGTQGNGFTGHSTTVVQVNPLNLIRLTDLIYVPKASCAQFTDWAKMFMVSLFYTKLNITGKGGSRDQILPPQVMKKASR